MRQLIVMLLVALILVGCRTAPTTSPADTELAAAAAAQEKGEYRTALNHAQKALNLAPELTKAHFMVGTIADDICLESAEPRLDQPICGLAISEYQRVLELEAKHDHGLKNLAFLMYRFARLDESESYYRRDLVLHADDPSLLDAVAAIDFARTMPRVMTAKSRFVTDKVWFQTHYCFEIRSENIGRLEEGIGLATRALQIAKNNPNVMGHLSALYSLRSNLDCMNQPVYEADMKMARTWDSERKRVSSEGKTTFFEKSPAAPPPMPDN